MSSERQSNFQGFGYRNGSTYCNILTNRSTMQAIKERFLSRQLTGSSSPENHVDSEAGDESIPYDNGDEKSDQSKPNKFSQQLKDKIRRYLSLNVNNMAAIKLKMLLPILMGFGFFCCYISSVEGGFFTFYFPNLFKPKGFNELSDMIINIEGTINETKDAFSDAQYFWGQLQDFDKQPPESIYPEESACSEVFPLFRDLAIEYAYIDYEYYLKPLEKYRDHLLRFRTEFYPLGLDSNAALPREWEQDLIKIELETKINTMDTLTNDPKFKLMRDKLIDIWKNVRRSLDTSLACLYLRYAYRQIAEDINQVALDTNLRGMQEALKMVESAYKRIEKFKKSDSKIIDEIKEEMESAERFTIKV